MSVDVSVVADEVFATVQDQGELSKQQIVETWGLPEERYRELQKVLSRKRGIDAGSQGVGGFVAVPPRRLDLEDSTETEFILRTEWERLTVDRLATLLKRTDLERLVGSLESTIRIARRVRSGKDRPSRLRELATALVLQHGVDLLASTDIRMAVGKASNVLAPQRWHAGKGAAAAFVVAAGFPTELAGVPSAESLPDMEYLEGRFRLEPLQHFQKEVHRKLLMQLYDLGRRCIVTLPTGGGKTRVAVESISVWFHDRYNKEEDRAQQGTVLWLAHTEELCEQACACFKQVWEGAENVAPMTLMRFWGDHTSDLVEQEIAIREVLKKPSVIVSTPQRVSNLLELKSRGSAAVLEDLLSALGLIVIDEAHRAAAPTYRRIFEALIRPDRRVSVFGLTATPFRKEYAGDDPEHGTRELKAIFNELVEPVETLGMNARVTLQGMGVLARPEFATIETSTRITIPDPPESALLTEVDMERIDRVMALRADNTARRLQILDRIVPLGGDVANSILYFGPSVRDAECMAYLLREQGITAAVISGTTRDVTRRQVVADFKAGHIRVLCNCEVLTTGFDAPKVTHVVMARPTVSRVLYEQIVGRGLRGPKFGGTETCQIIDCEDDFQGLRPTLGYESFRRVWYATPREV